MGGAGGALSVAFFFSVPTGGCEVGGSGGGRRSVEVAEETLRGGSVEASLILGGSTGEAGASQPPVDMRGMITSSAATTPAATAFSM